MQQEYLPAGLGNGKGTGIKPFLREIWKYRLYYALFLPGFLLVILFRYGPMYGLQIAFKDYTLMQGIWDSPWVGLKHFYTFLHTPTAIKTVLNTVVISCIRFLFDFPLPMIFAIFIFEIRNRPFRKIVQTVSVFPYFLSWVVFGGIMIFMFSPSQGPVNIIISALGGKPIYFLTKPQYFRWILGITGALKDTGWGAILYLAALSNINIQLYESAVMDGASKIRRIWHITIPMLSPVMVISVLMFAANILDGNFDQVFNMYNPMVYSTGDIIQTYTFRMGINNMQYSFASAVGFFNSFVGLLLILAVNYLTKRIQGENRFGLW